MFPTKDKELLKLLSQSKILVKGSGNYIYRRLREDDVFRTADHCRFTIGENTQFNGAMLYLQDDDSHICIGKNTMFSWGIDVLVYGCTYHL